jgi:WD40 repeat protein
MATGSNDFSVRVWDLTSGFPACEPLLGHTGHVYCLAFGQTGEDGPVVLASGSWDYTVRLWDPVAGEPPPPSLFVSTL